MREGKRWIVLKDRISVVEKSGSVGSEDVIVASRELADEPRRKIIEQIDAAKRAVGGTDIRADGVLDGLSLSICFTPDGESGADNISIHNATVEEVSPLLALVSRYGPDQHPIEFEKEISRFTPSRERPIARRSLGEWEKIAWPKPKMPWWCLWREFSN
jgi:hypothetical protein